MEETYLIKNNDSEKPVEIGKFARLVHTKHISSYGETSASEIQNRMVSIYKDSQKLLTAGANHNLLLVGKVQSGKTSNLEMFTALAFDNGYNLMIMYGGYDDTLLAQTNTRFRETFDIPLSPSIESPHPVFFSTSDKVDFDAFDDSIVKDMMEYGKPIIITSMKRPAAMKKVNAFLAKLKVKNIRAFIIDDEGDQASLNAAKDKVKDATATYQQICFMKDHLKNPLYLSVTASPHANIFSPTISRLVPSESGIRLIDAGNGYCGSAVYHLGDPDLITEIDDFEDDVDGNKMPESMKYAIKYFFIAAAIMHKRGMRGADMLVHSYREVDTHKKIHAFIENYIKGIRDILKYKQKNDIAHFINELKEVFDAEFSSAIQTKEDFDSLVPIIFEVIVAKAFIFLKNSKGNLSTLAIEQLKPFRIFVGGDLLQRGVTFKHLVVTYFTRWANSGNMDTVLQRARWFGYRNKFIDVCKIFTTSEIQKEFTNLADMEIDLWDQFRSVQQGELKLNDIIIPAGDSRLGPTRKSVAPFKKVEFARRWTKQQLGIFDKTRVNANNDIINKFIASHKFEKSNIGRTDKEISCIYSLVNSGEVINLMNSLKDIFAFPPFSLNAHIINDLLSEQKNVPIIVMNEGRGRERKFDTNNRINNIHQGPDKTEVDERKYLGDTEVIINKNLINIQIHYIKPKRRSDEYNQYMFAIFVPGRQSYFVKGEI